MRKRAALLKHPTHLLSLGFGTGLAPFAPGTWGTLVGIPFVLILSQFALPIYLGALALCFLVGIYLCGQTGQVLGVHDDPAIVWDEIVGFGIAMIAVPVQWQTLVLAFLLFRFFDIRKPWPIRNIDRATKGGFGVMLDDALAGAFTLVILQALIKAGTIPF